MRPTVLRWSSRDSGERAFSRSVDQRRPQLPLIASRRPVGWHPLQTRNLHAAISPWGLRDHNNVTLPPATGQSFWLNGAALEYPSFENAESLVKRLAKSGIISRDPIVEDTLLRRPRGLSLRSSQRHFLRSTGVTYAAFRQVERARYATILLRDGVPIQDVVSRLGYFDQAHLTRSLRRFIGETPAKIMQRQRQLSFLYKTEFPDAP